MQINAKQHNGIKGGNDVKVCLDIIVRNCEMSEGGGLFGQRLHLMKMLMEVLRAEDKVRELEARAAERPLMQLPSKQMCDSVMQKLEECGRLLRQRFHPKNLSMPEVGGDDCHRRMTDSLFHGEAAGTHREAAQKWGEAIETLLSEAVLPSSRLLDAAVEALARLAERFARLAELEDKTWSGQQFEAFVCELEQEFTGTLCYTYQQAQKRYSKWKRKNFDDTDQGEYMAFISDQLLGLLDSPFIIVERDHMPKSYTKSRADLQLYLSDEQCTEERLMKFYNLCRITGYKNGRFMFDQKHKLGRYLFRHREKLGSENIAAFFFFQITCYDRNGKVVKNVTSDDDGTVEDAPDRTDTGDGTSGGTGGSTDTSSGGTSSGTGGSGSSSGDDSGSMESGD